MQEEGVRAHLMDVLGGVSPDYAIVAQKSCGEADAALFDEAFDADYGLSLVELAARFEAGATGRMSMPLNRFSRPGRNRAPSWRTGLDSRRSGRHPP